VIYKQDICSNRAVSIVQLLILCFARDDWYTFAKVYSNFLAGYHGNLQIFIYFNYPCPGHIGTTIKRMGCLLSLSHKQHHQYLDRHL